MMNSRNNAVTFGSPCIDLNYKRRGPTSCEKKLAEKIFLRRIYNGHRTVRECQIPNTRAKFLIVFSPDGTKVACTNGNHNVYLIDVRTKKILKTLSGHKRTPWTVAFHPTNNNILASGCLSGEVRVWNLEDDSFESWQSPGQTVIASVAFHPKVKLLVIATYRDLYFWDWNTSMLFGQTSTENDEEKIRYVKFDSTGDKLITAVALKSKLLSQYDSICFREAYQFTKERDILKDFRLIEKFSENHLSNLKELRSETAKIESSDFGNTMEMPPGSVFVSRSKLDLIDETMPYMCLYHHDAVQSFLNVGCFCPTEFSINVINVFKQNSLSIEYFAEKCYFCRYTWLYHAIYEFQLVNDSKSHICKEFRFLMNEKHVWKFSEARRRELTAENQDVANGVTEETLRYCFERFARICIAPHFASVITDGVCSKCTPPETANTYRRTSEGGPEMRKPFSHNVSMRSDCFLNACEMFKFSPAGSFAPFMTAFAEVYQYLPALQQISTKEDRNILNSMMTEWEYLYCKLLLINSIVEGDDGLILRKPIVNLLAGEVKSCSKEKKEPSNPCCNLYFNREKGRKRLKLFNLSLFGATVVGETVNARASTSSSPDVPNSLRSSNSESTEGKSDCQCRNFDEEPDNSTSAAMKLLRRELDNLANAISRRYDYKTQRLRIEKLYEQQLGYEINRTNGALFRTIQITKKCIRVYLSTFLTELKKLVKVNLSQLGSYDTRFSQVFSRLFMFIIRRAIVFTSSLLEFLCNFKYDINELTKNNSVKLASSPLLIPITPRRLEHMLLHRRNYCFAINSKDDPIFEEEYQSADSELSDDELSSSTSECITSDNSPRLSAFIGERSNRESSNISALDLRLPLLSARKVIASGIYLSKHLRFLDSTPQGCHLDRGSLDSYQMLLLQNVNSLFNHFLCQTTEEIADLRNYHPLHRLQIWDFSNLEIPNISSKIQNTVVTECKVHNDATIAISSDDSRVAVLLSPNQFDPPDWLGVFSIEWKTLGHILCAVSLNQIAVSVSFSPTSQYLAVGYSYTYTENLKMADIIAAQQEMDLWKDLSLHVRPPPIVTSLIDVPEPNRVITVNCIKWIPVAGQGVVFGNSLGEIKFVS